VYERDYFIRWEHNMQYEVLVQDGFDLSVAIQLPVLGTTEVSVVRAGWGGVSQSFADVINTMTTKGPLAQHQAWNYANLTYSNSGINVTSGTFPLDLAIPPVRPHCAHRPQYHHWSPG
jgi:hypothetical protein